MIIYIAALTTVLCLWVLALIYLADLWEREPLDLIQNVFLAGLIAQLTLILAVDRLAGLESWSGWLYALTATALASLLPVVLAEEKELDERFDGVVYAVAFTAGAASVVHLFNLPGAAARHPELVVLDASTAPGFRDLWLLVSATGPRGELVDLLTLLLIAAPAGAVLGTLKLRGRPLGSQIAGTLVVGLALVAVDQAAGGWWPARLTLAAVALVTAVALKRTSVFRRGQPQPEREVFLGALKTGLMIFGAVVLALALLLSLTDSWQAVAGAEHSLPGLGSP